MQKCVIIGASPSYSIGLLQKAACSAGLIICADGGYQAAIAAGLTPQVWVGDGDSAGSVTPAPNVHNIRLRAEKDETDMQAALDYGLAQGFRQFVLTGCTGGRLDHFLANIGLLERLHDIGAQGEIWDAQNILFLHPGGRAVIPKPSDFMYISVIPLDMSVSGVTLTGLRYPLRNALVRRTESLAVSNEFIADSAEVEIAQGRALIILSRDFSPQ